MGEGRAIPATGGLQVPAGLKYRRAGEREALQLALAARVGTRDFTWGERPRSPVLSTGESSLAPLATIIGSVVRG